MTAYPHTFNLAVNLAERVLFVLFYERQTPVFVLHKLKFLLYLRYKLVEIICALLPLRRGFSHIFHHPRSSPTVCTLIGCDRHSACCEKKDY